MCSLNDACASDKDGSLTAAGRRHVKQIEKKDAKWAHKNHDKIYVALLFRFHLF